MRKYRARVILVFVAAVLLFVLYWILTHAFISISLDGTPTAETEIQIIELVTRKTTIIKLNGPTTRRLVRSGKYEILAQNNSGSYFAAVKVGGLLQTTSAKGKLTAQKSRSFVGNDPAPCMGYTGKILVSLSCGGGYDQARIHVPASEIEPTYTKKGSYPGVATIKNIALTKLGLLALFEESSDDPDTSSGSFYTAYPVRDDLSLSGGVFLSDVPTNSSLKISSYKKGFITYDEAISSINYYASLAENSKPSKIEIQKPNLNNASAYAIDTREDSLLIGYTAGNVGANDAEKPKTFASEVVVQNDKTASRFYFSKTYGSIKLCGESRLCMLQNNILDVYDISSPKQKLLYSVGDVVSSEISNGKLLLLRKNDILSLDTSLGVGSIDYNFGNYRYCGVGISASGYVLCLINPSNEKVALHINQSGGTNDDIDKKVLEIGKDPIVKTVSAYGSYIFISPDLGEVEYDESIGSFNYSATQRAAASKKINELVVKAGINPKVYTIINTLQ